MLQPVVIGTWNWVQQSTPQELCHEFSLHPTEIIDSLSQEILTTHQPINYSLYSKLFSLIYTTSIPLPLCLKIDAAMKSIGLFEIPIQNEIQIHLMLKNALEAHELDKSLAYFARLKKGFGFEETCNEMFIIAYQYQFSEFITQALATLQPERKQHILSKCLLYAAERGHIQSIQFWINCGASLYAFNILEQHNRILLKTTGSMKTLFHIAALTNNQELALLLINNNFDITRLGDFNPLNYFIERQYWAVVKAYVEKYHVVGTSEAQISHLNICALINCSLSTHQILLSEQVSISILIALFNSGFDLKQEYPLTNGKNCSMLDYICSVGNGHAFLMVIRALNGVSALNNTHSLCNTRLAEFFKLQEANIEDIVFNLLTLDETRQSIFNILFMIADTFKLDGMFDALLDRDLPEENLLKNLLETHTFSDECLLNILWKYKTYSSIIPTIPTIIKSIKRRFTAEETIALIKLANPVSQGALYTGNSPRTRGAPEIFNALMEKESPYKLTTENNLLDIVISHFHCGGSILLLLNKGFHVLNCGQKIICEAIKEEDELLLDRALTLGANLETCRIDDVDPFSFAVYMNKVYAIKLMIQRGRDPDKVLARPFPDGSEDGSLKPLELAVRNGRYEAALCIAEHSEELHNHILGYQALFPAIMEDKNNEQARKNLLSFLLRDFPFVQSALKEAPIAQFNNHVVAHLQKMSDTELAKIESKGRSIFEVPWLFDRLPSLGFRMLRGLTAYQAVQSLEKLQLRLKSKTPQAFQYLLGINAAHYHTIKIEPVLEPIVTPSWDDAIDNLAKVYAKNELTKYQDHLVHLKGLKGKLELGFLNYPKDAAAKFSEHFNGPFFINEMANLINRFKTKRSVVYLFDQFFSKPITCLHIHEMLMLAGYGLWSDLYEELIDKKETYRDDEHVLTAEQLRSGAGRIFLYTSKRKKYIGTPRKKTPEIEQFYAMVRNSVLQVLRWLDKCKAIETKRFCITEVGMAGNRCGGRWLGCLHQQMKLLKEDKAQLITLVDEIYIDLLHKRQIVFDRLMEEYSNDVHIHNQLYKMISASLGLPGGEIFEFIHDNFENLTLSKNRALAKFNAKYHPSLIIGTVHRFLQDVYKKAERREYLMLWIKENLPDEMNAQIYSPMIEAVKKAMENKKSREEIKKILGDVVWNSDEPNPLRAIEDHRFREFLGEVVLDDDGQLRISFVIYMLFRINVLSKPERQKVHVV